LLELVNFDAKIAAEIGASRAYDFVALGPLKTNEAPFKGIRVLPDSYQVEQSFDGSRFPRRPSHITVVPFHEMNAGDETKAKAQELVDKELEVTVLLDEVSWTRGSASNAAGGTLGAFYCNLVLSEASIAAIQELREKCGLPPTPPTPPQAFNDVDDPRLQGFRFHRSIGCIIPDFMEELEAVEWTGMTPDDVAVKIAAYRDRLAEWMAGFRIVPKGFGNALKAVSSN
jgi:hypothetical protein